MSGFVGEGTPLTAQGTVDGTRKATYELPLLGRFVVESVVATIDASGGGDTSPTLTVLDKSGAVIARKSQTSKIPAGDSGDATWALRLPDELSSPPAATGTPYALVLGSGAANPTSPPSNQPYVPLGSSYFATDGGAYFAHAAGFVSILQPGVYRCTVGAYGVNGGTQVSAGGQGGSGTGGSALGGAGDINQSTTWNLIGPWAPLSPFSFDQKDTALFVVWSGDVAAGISLGPMLLTSTGWIRGGEYGINTLVERLGDVPAGWPP